MTGPEHYKTAERLLANRPDCAGDGTSEANQIAAAQVHSTLALAAATAMSTWTVAGMPQPDRMDWWRAASGEPAERERVKNANHAEFATEGQQ